MLHRMALRVLPSLSLAVTDEAVRRRKRIVMFVPGLVAFGAYRLAKQAMPLSEPLTLLFLSGLVSLVTAAAAYRVGRATSWSAILQEDKAGLLAWMMGWIGAVYGVQLSLLVLALLWLVGYDYARHPDGPAMMAIIIACTAVARDAFEIGHVRKVAVLGRPFATFPNGAPLRELVRTQASRILPWIGIGLALGALAALTGPWFEQQHVAALAQLGSITVIGGAVALMAYFGGLSPTGSWGDSLRRTPPAELFKYWWWPGMAFASTYYLVIMGAVLFVGGQSSMTMGPAVLGGALVTALMGLYGFYLGYRRHIEDQERPQITSGMLRCPFVMGILGKKEPAAETGSIVLGKVGSKG